MAQRLPFSGEQYWNACKRNAFKGACMFTYEAGTTTTLKTTWTTADATVEHPNPIQADSNGIFPEIYGTGEYYIEIKNNFKDEIIYQADNIQGVGTISYQQVGSLTGDPDNDAVNAPFEVGAFIETYEYNAGSGVGGGKYKKVSVDPGNNLINPATTDNNWLLLIGGPYQIETASAIGDGVTDNRDAFSQAVSSGISFSGTEGKTYFISISSPSDTIQVKTGANLSFPDSSFIKWDYFGAPCFIVLDGESDIEINNPSFIWGGTATNSPPNTTAQLESAFGLPASYKSSVRPYMANICVFGADNVTINNSSTTSDSPGVINRAIPCHIGIGPKNDFSQGENLIINNLDLNDYFMGVLGNGYNGLHAIGSLRSGRYDDYSDFSWGAPGHFMYLTDNNTRGSNITVGDIYDVGEYTGSSADGSYQCFKIRYTDGFTVSKITSFRPHGVFDGFGLTDGYVGPIYWRNRATTGNVLVGRAFKIDNDGTASSDCDDITFESISLSMPTLNQQAVQLLGRAADKLKDVKILDLFIDMDMSALSGTPLIQWRATDSSIIKSVFKSPTLSGASVVSFDSHASGNYVEGKSIGAGQANRVSITSSGPNWANIDVAKLNTTPLVNDEFLAIADNSTAVLNSPISHSSRTASSFPSNTVFSQDITLPSQGVYLVNVSWIDGTEVNAMSGTWMVVASDSGGSADYASAQQIGVDISGGTAFDNIDITTTAAGVLTATANLNTARAVRLFVSYTRIGILGAI